MLRNDKDKNMLSNNSQLFFLGGELLPDFRCDCVTSVAVMLLSLHVHYEKKRNSLLA